MDNSDIEPELGEGAIAEPSNNAVADPFPAGQVRREYVCIQVDYLRGGQDALGILQDDFGVLPDTQGEQESEHVHSFIYRGMFPRCPECAGGADHENCINSIYVAPGFCILNYQFFPKISIRNPNKPRVEIGGDCSPLPEKWTHFLSHYWDEDLDESAADEEQPKSGTQAATVIPFPGGSDLDPTR